jgi:hypothetical protein
MDVAHQLFAAWEPLVNKYKHHPNVEIEVRLGSRGAKSFEPNVGKDFFDKVLRAMQKYAGWEATSEKQYAVYYGPGGKRITVDEATDESVAVIKRRLVVDDFTLVGNSYDVRIGISSEVPYVRDDENEVMESVKSKKRWSFVRKNLSIDMSIMKGEQDDPDSDSDTTYHIELEIVDPTRLQTRDELFNILYKIFDITSLS